MLRLPNTKSEDFANGLVVFQQAKSPSSFLWRHSKGELAYIRARILISNPPSDILFFGRRRISISPRFFTLLCFHVAKFF